jgi:hypothetical protein
MAVKSFQGACPAGFMGGSAGGDKGIEPDFFRRSMA